MNLSGKVALITGGTKGIGLAVARELAKAGMHVAITSRSAETASEVAQAINRTFRGRCLGIAADVRSMEDQQNAVDRTIENFGQIDVLIANAGVGHFSDIETMTAQEWNEVIDTNLTGVFYSVKAGLESLKNTKGYLITISSLAGTNFFPKGAAYNASKFGLVGFTQAVMLDVRKHGIKTTVIMPGSVATHFNGHVPSEADAWKIQPEDLGQMVVDLLNMNPRTLPSKIEVRPTMPK